MITPILQLTYYDKAYDFSKTSEDCYGFQDVGCDKIGPFVLCAGYGVTFKAVPEKICVVIKNEYMDKVQEP